MSLLHRSSSQESFSRRPSNAGDDNHGRRMSYNPVGEWVPPVAHNEPVGAYEVSSKKRIVQVIAAVIYCLFAAGIVFGYAAIKPVLIEEGVYRELCSEKELEDDVEVCYDQEIRLNLMFTIAAVATNVSALPIGVLLDRSGPRVTSLIGCAFLAIGCLFMAFARDMRPVDGYVPGYLFLALGGPFIFISSFQLSNTFPRHSGLILAFITGAFDSSSAIFLFYRLIYSASEETFRPKRFFSIYLIVPIAIATVQIFVMPRKSYKTVSELVKQAEEDTTLDEPPDSNGQLSASEVGRLRAANREHRQSVVSEITSLLGNKTGAEQSKSEETKRHRSGVWGALHGRTAWQQIRTAWWGLIALFTILQMLRINYFVATVRPQYAYLLHSLPAAREINAFFDFALPLGGVVAIPFIGLILDNTSTPFVLGLLVTTATTIGVLGVLPYRWAGYANIVLFVLYRPLYYTTVSDYAAKVFGFVTFGKVYGLIICVAGLFNFLQTPLDAVTHGTFGNDPVPVNVALLVVTAIVGSVLVAYVGVRSRSIEREKLEDEAEGSRDTLVPGADPRASEDHHPVDVHGYGATDGT